jgi:hypothetical protein
MPSILDGYRDYAHRTELHGNGVESPNPELGEDTQHRAIGRIAKVHFGCREPAPVSPALPSARAVDIEAYTACGGEWR